MEAGKICDKCRLPIEKGAYVEVTDLGTSHTYVLCGKCYGGDILSNRTICKILPNNLICWAVVGEALHNFVKESGQLPEAIYVTFDNLLTLMSQVIGTMAFQGRPLSYWGIPIKGY